MLEPSASPSCDQPGRATYRLRELKFFHRLGQSFWSWISRNTLLISTAAILILMVVATDCTVQSVASHGEYPGGCDWFGYMRQAQLFRERGVIGGLNTAIADPVTRYLIEKGKSLGMLPSRWAYLVGPQCHNYQIRTDQVTLQYPPGTGFVLSFFPEGVQARSAFVLWSVTILLICSLPALATRSPLVPLLAGALGLYCLYVLHYFADNWSIPASIAASLSAGYFTVASFAASSLRRRLLLTLALGLLLGLSVSIRIANAFMIFGYVAVLGSALLLRRTREYAVRVVGFIGSFMVGLVPVFAANSINAGGPLATTYAAANTVPLNFAWQSMREGLLFYFSEHPVAGALILTAAALLAGLMIFSRRIRTPHLWPLIVLASLSLASNLEFFILHVPRNDYYVVPITTLITSIALFVIIDSENRRCGSVSLADRRVMFGLLFVLISGSLIGTRVRSFPVHHQVPGVSFPLRATDVVWAGLWTGSFHYFLNRQASVPYFVVPEVQDAFIEAIARDGVRQFIVEDEWTRRLVMDRLSEQYRLRPVGQAFGQDVYEIEMR